MLEIVVELIVVVWVVRLNFWLFFVFVIDIDVVHAQGSCFSHCMDVLPEDMLGHVGVTVVDI